MTEQKLRTSKRLLENISKKRYSVICKDNVFKGVRLSEDCYGNTLQSSASDKTILTFLQKNSDVKFQTIFHRPPIIPKPRKVVKDDKCANVILELDECQTEVKKLKKAQKSCNYAPVFDTDKNAPTFYSGKTKYKAGRTTTIYTAGSTINGWFYIVPLAMVQASHLPPTFKANPKYPAGCQERRYDRDDQLKQNVNARVASFDALFLLADTPSAEDGAPIVDIKKGITLGGNSRIMMLKLLAESGKYSKYSDNLKKVAPLFGFAGVFDDKDFEEKKLVLIRGVDVDMSKCSTYSWLLNTSTKNETNILDRAVAIAKELTPKHYEEIAMTLDGSNANTFSDMMKDKAMVRNLKDILIRTKIITTSNASKFLIDNDEFTEEGKLVLEKMLLGAILPDKMFVEKARSYSVKIIRCLNQFLQIKNYPREWRLPVDTLPRVVELEYERRNYNNSREVFLKQTRMFIKKPSKLEELMWEIMDLKTTEIREILDLYISVANHQVTRKEAIFPPKELKAFDVLQECLNRIKYPEKADKTAFLGDKPKSTVRELFANDPIVKFFKRIFN